MSKGSQLSVGVEQQPVNALHKNWEDLQKQWEWFKSIPPIGSMYGIFTYIWLISMVNVGKYTIHGWYGHYQCNM